MQKICSLCGKVYGAIRIDQRHCPKCVGKRKYYTLKPIHHRECKECYKPFSTRRPLQVYCSDRCRHKSNYTYQEKTKVCLYCHKSFITTSNKRMYCCREHYLAAKKERSK